VFEKCGIRVWSYLILHPLCGFVCAPFCWGQCGEIRIAWRTLDKMFLFLFFHDFFFIIERQWSVPIEAEDRVTPSSAWTQCSVSVSLSLPQFLYEKHRSQMYLVKMSYTTCVHVVPLCLIRLIIYCYVFWTFITKPVQKCQCFLVFLSQTAPRHKVWGRKCSFIERAVL